MTFRRLVPGALALASLALSACGMHVRGQHMPEHAVVARPADFQVADGTVVMHYYGAGGWGIQWKGTYVLAAPYFTNHPIPKLLASQAAGHSGGMVDGPQIVPDVEAVKAGFANTPVAGTRMVLIGHGHIDHAGDVPAFFEPGLISGKPVLVADRSTTNELAAMKDRFSCIAPIDYGDADDVSAMCPVPHVRVTPIHSAHAPHYKLAGLEVAAFGGAVNEEQKTLPHRAEDYRLGNTWAYMIDLLDDDGKVAFRIHYVDASSSPPHAIAPKKLLAERDVDVHIACVPSYDLVEDYPEAVLRYHNVRYLLGGHWEDFFQPRTEPLVPLQHVLDEDLIDNFMKIVERTIPEPRGVQPLNKSEKECEGDRCGPHGKTWTLPVPGETFHFAAGPQQPAPKLPAAVAAPE